MPYASKQDLEDVYGVDLVTRLSDHNNDGVADEEPIEKALVSASSIIDSHLAARYSVPLDVPTPVIRDLAIDIAWYRLAYSRLKQTDEMRLRYEDAIKLLQRIAEGKASVGLDTGDGTGGDGSSDDQSGAYVGRTQYINRA
jgi:phage gp36-like protein